MTLKDGKRGRFHEPMVSWVSRDNDRRSVLVHIEGRVSLGELYNYLCDHAPDIDVDDILINGSVRWERDSTEEERAERARWLAESEERRISWERRFWAQMVEQYGPDGPPVPEDYGPADMDFQVCPAETDGAGRRMPGAEWTVWAHHRPTGLRAVGRAEYKIAAMEAAITELQQLVALGLPKGD